MTRSEKQESEIMTTADRNAVSRQILRSKLVEAHRTLASKMHAFFKADETWRRKAKELEEERTRTIYSGDVNWSALPRLEKASIRVGQWEARRQLAEDERKDARYRLTQIEGTLNYLEDLDDVGLLFPEGMLDI
jgi:chromosome segregation ATPase